jgi:hypothetical protein
MQRKSRPRTSPWRWRACCARACPSRKRCRSRRRRPRRTRWPARPRTARPQDHRRHGLVQGGCRPAEPRRSEVAAADALPPRRQVTRRGDRRDPHLPERRPKVQEIGGSRRADASPPMPCIGDGRGRGRHAHAGRPRAARRHTRFRQRHGRRTSRIATASAFANKRKPPQSLEGQEAERRQAEASQEARPLLSHARRLPHRRSMSTPTPAR